VFGGALEDPGARIRRRVVIARIIVTFPSVRNSVWNVNWLDDTNKGIVILAAMVAS
jgi:hypothetical protein